MWQKNMWGKQFANYCLVHAVQQLGRGLGDDVTLITWLHDRIWPYESNLTADDVYVSTQLTILEQIR